MTYSTEVGKYLYEQSGKTLKKLTLELGGHAPFIVLNDAELQLAVTESLKAKFRNNGQTCIAANRFFIQSKIYDDYLKELKAQVHKLKIGNPLEENVDLSTILHPSVLKKIELQKKDALAKGAKVVSGGNNLYDPLILENCHPSMLIFNEETFGPIIALMKFDHLDEGIFLANQTSYGLAAYAITSHLNSCQQLIDQLEYGIIGINDGLPSTPQASFGGWNASGFGREGGPSGIYEYLQEKYISLGIH